MEYQLRFCPLYLAFWFLSFGKIIECDINEQFTRYILYKLFDLCKSLSDVATFRYFFRHIPKAKATTIAETPETKRIAENTKIQSNVKYHADFEKAKGKLTQVRELSKNNNFFYLKGERERKTIINNCFFL